MLLAGISLLSYRRRTALLWKVEGSSLFLCFFLQTIIKTVDSNVQLYFHIFIYCHFFIGEINLEISKRFKRLLYAILQERINNRVLNHYRLHSMMIHTKKHYSFMTMIIGICIHLDAWYKMSHV